ncbi:MAG: hypothetical protein KAJ19_28175, partial [Gammaproteobacteria bacterium]|nr:hypothetical protein [Gammaproteobacteria bacterium]
SGTTRGQTSCLNGGGRCTLPEHLRGGNDAHPYRAHVRIECIIGQCPGWMELVMLRRDGTLLHRPENDGPFYRCNRVGCHYHEHPRGLHEFSSEWIRDTSESPKRHIAGE